MKWNEMRWGEMRGTELSRLIIERMNSYDMKWSGMKWWYEMRSNVCTYFHLLLYQLSHWHSSLDAWHEHHEPGNDCEPYGHMWLHRSGSIGLHPNQTLENTGYCLEISWTPMNKRTTCLYCHWCSSIPPELPGCVVPSLEKSGYTSSTEKYLDNLWNPDTNREPQAASHAWWIIHTTGHHLDIETKMLRNRAEQVLVIPPLADSGGMAPFGHVWPHADRLFFFHCSMCVLFFQQRLF